LKAAVAVPPVTLAAAALKAAVALLKAAVVD